MISEKTSAMSKAYATTANVASENKAAPSNAALAMLPSLRWQRQSGSLDQHVVDTILPLPNAIMAE